MMTQLHGNILPYKGKMPKIADDVFVAPGAQIIGDVEIGAGSSIWFNCVLRGDDNPIRIGERVNVQDGTVIHVHSKFQGTYIGSDITIGHMALLHACNIQDKAFVGMGSIVLDRCTIETNGMLAGGAMLTPGKTVKTGELWAGRPATFMRALSDEEIGNFDWSFQSYSERAGEYRDEYAALARERGLAAE
jgi:carbonic anhydrase/acetyltransferase-like protein (isoleucine patch superfamily)